MTSEHSQACHLLEHAIHALNGANHGICAALDADSSITPMQIYCLLELVGTSLSESLAQLNDTK